MRDKTFLFFFISIFSLSFLQAQQARDSIRALLPEWAQIDSLPPLNAQQLEREPWFYDINEARKQPEKVYKLSLQGEGLKEFPMAITEFCNLQVLNLSKNKLSELPAEMVKLRKLQTLIMAKNHLMVLPESFRYMDNLSQLYLGRNRLNEIPAWFGGMGKLRHLDLSYNYLTPLEINLLQNLLPRCSVTH